jgi:hypothetical protein
MAERGARVELPPHTDYWMRGDKYGTITNVDTLGYGSQDPVATIKLDRSKKKIQIAVASLQRWGKINA